MEGKKIISGFIEFSLLLLIMLILTFLFFGCKHDPILDPVASDGAGNTNGSSDTISIPESTCDPDTTYFTNNILPLFISNCAKSGCHDAASHQKDIILNSYTNVMASGEIESGDPSEGDIMEVITEDDPDKIMPPPPNIPLTQNQISMITEWISQGAKNNSCSGSCDTTNVTYTGTISPLLIAKCAGCHNSATSSGNINLTTYSGAQLQALNGRMLGAISHTPGYTPLPQGGSMLPDCEIDEIRIWIENGAPNN